MSPLSSTQASCDQAAQDAGHRLAGPRLLAAAEGAGSAEAACGCGTRSKGNCARSCCCRRVQVVFTGRAEGFVQREDLPP